MFGLTKNEERKLRIIIFIIVLVSAVVMSTYLIIDVRKSINRETEYEFSGIVNEIRMNVNVPTVQINNNDFPLGTYSSRLRFYVTVGDSLVKTKGHHEITLYRKNKEGKYMFFETYD